MPNSNDHSWIQSYQAYDDEALAAFANPGLLRRAYKDLEGGGVRWQHVDAQGGVVETDQQQVTLDRRGPKLARCTCPAAGTCKHLVTAVLWLRAMASTNTATPAEPATTSEPPADAKPKRTAWHSVEALDLTQVFQKVGRATIRRALAIEYALVDAQVSEFEQRLEVKLPALGVDVHWLAGAGFEGMVSTGDPREHIVHHLLALATIWRQRGLSFPWPKAESEPTDVAAERASERAFLQLIQQNLGELLQHGLSHLSELSAQRIRALNLSARAESLPRLATELRRLATTLEQLAQRDTQVQTRDVLSQMAQIHALSCALECAEGDLGQRLRGVRTTSQQIDPNQPNSGQPNSSQTYDLLALGAEWWQAPSGARGLSLCFYDLKSQSILETVIARPDGSDPNFQAQTVWASQTLWPGAGSPERICAAGGLLLQGAGPALDGRLAVQSTQSSPASAQLQAWTDERVQHLNTLGYAHWQRLSQDLQALAGLSSKGFAYYLLRPSSAARPVFDDIEQCLNWTLGDEHGNALTVQLFAQSAEDRAISNLENCFAVEHPDARLLAVLVHAARTQDRIRLRPVSLIRQVNQRIQLEPLGFATIVPPPQTGLLKRALNRWRQATPPAHAVQADASPTSSHRPLSAILQAILSFLNDLAMLGHTRVEAYERSELTQISHHLRGAGLDSLSAMIDQLLTSPSPAGFLRLVYLCERTLVADALNQWRD